MRKFETVPTDDLKMIKQGLAAYSLYYPNYTAPNGIISSDRARKLMLEIDNELGERFNQEAAYV